MLLRRCDKVWLLVCRYGNPLLVTIGTIGPRHIEEACHVGRGQEAEATFLGLLGAKRSWVRLAGD